MCVILCWINSRIKLGFGVGQISRVVYNNAWILEIHIHECYFVPVYKYALLLHQYLLIFNRLYHRLTAFIFYLMAILIYSYQFTSKLHRILSK